MKNTIRSAFSQALSDRKLLLLLLALFIGGVGYIIYVALSLNASDLQLATRYTSFGETHLYRSKWYYLLSFIGFGLIFLVAHTGMTIKLYVSEMKQLAYAFAWLSLIVLGLLIYYTYSVLGIAYLS